MSMNIWFPIPVKKKKKNGHFYFIYSIYDHLNNSKSTLLNMFYI